jgi:hypothetical protein
MAKIWKAVVKMDPPETYSTGGVVIMVRQDDENATYGPGGNTPYTIPKGCKIIPCNENVKTGWIYTDKTYLFVDSNVSDN